MESPLTVVSSFDFFSGSSDLKIRLLKMITKKIPMVMQASAMLKMAGKK